MSSQLQKQDLRIYNDGSVVSDKLLSNQQFKSLNLITHIQGTSSSWLITGIIENALIGSSYFNISKSQHGRHDIRLNPRSNVIFVSLYDSAKFYNRTFKKFLKMDIMSEKFEHFSFIDMLTDPVDVGHKDGVFHALHEKIISMSKKDQTRKIQIVIQAPELILHMTDLKVDDFLFQLQEICKLADVTLVVANDRSLVEPTSDNPNEIANKHAQFLIKLMHRSNSIISLRPLTTGRADDITGQLKISRGLLGLDDIDLEVNESEYLYLINKESNVKLFFK